MNAHELLVAVRNELPKNWGKGSIFNDETGTACLVGQLSYHRYKEISPAEHFHAPYYEGSSRVIYGFSSRNKIELEDQPFVEAIHAINQVAGDFSGLMPDRLEDEGNPSYEHNLVTWLNDSSPDYERVLEVVDAAIAYTAPEPQIPELNPKEKELTPV